MTRSVGLTSQNWEIALRGPPTHTRGKRRYSSKDAQAFPRALALARKPSYQRQTTIARVTPSPTRRGLERNRVDGYGQDLPGRSMRAASPGLMPYVPMLRFNSLAQGLTSGNERTLEDEWIRLEI